MTTIIRSSRLPGLVLAAIVAVTALAIVGNAVQTVTMPNISTTLYNLAPGANSPDITVPIFNSPVQVTAGCVTLFRRGLAQVTMQRTSVAPLFIQWLGLGSSGAPVIVSDWWPGGANPHIAWVDFANQVELRAVSASAFDVRSLIPGGGPAAVGRVTMIW